ncbi:hypothetical protein [Haloferax sp. YSSS75]|uniref:hypothetical protein n=1 Tax=Haloferax sp. YSSS75 TaxID=3388564 RepID=UPI00398CB094
MVELSVLLNALALFVPAMIGVSGSYYIYRTRQNDLEENLRTAFLAEMEGVEYLDMWPETNYTVPTYNFLSLSVYESNSDSLGVLTNEEVEAIVQYYTRAKSVQDLLRLHSDIVVQTKGFMESDTGLSKRKKGVRKSIDRLELARQRAINHIRSARNKEELPKEGMSVSSTSSGIEKDETLLLDYGFAERTTGEDTVITTKGERFFDGDVMLTGLEKERDILDRDKHPTIRKFERLWEWLVSTLL